jgi:4-amino-4-deoxy-L-arabinose transferase-like glycosyltransferase
LNRLLQPAIRNFALLFLGCLLFHLAGTWSLPLIDRDEPRFAEAAREMQERGDYVVPYFNDDYRFDKPPLTYWCQVLSYRLFGANDFAARFPSAVAAALTAMLLLAWGARLDNPRVGWWAAIIFTLCLQTFMHAKAAVADMWLVLFVTAAHWAGYELLFPKAGSPQTPHLKHQIFFSVTLALAFLAKGPIGWVPLITVAIVRPSILRRFSFFLGIALTLALVSLWGIPALLRTHGEFFRVGIGRHVIGRSFATMEGHGARSWGVYLLTLPFYFVTVFLSFFPWSIKLPWLTRKLWRERAGMSEPGDHGRLDSAERYLIVGVLVIFVIFTLVKTKLPHYTLPAFPLLSLLLARHWPAQGATSSFRKMAVVTASAWLAIALLIFPLCDRVSPARELFLAAKRDLRPEMQFGAAGYNEPSLVWYFRKQVRGFLHPGLNAKKARRFMDENGGRFLILPTATVLKVYPTLPDGWKTFPAQGINIAKGKRVDLTLLLKPQ